MHAKLLTYIWSDLASTPSNASLAAEELLACGGGRKRVLNARPHCGSSAVQPAMPSQTDGTRSESATAVTHVPPKGPAGMSFVALPAPIASTLPPPTVIEPLLAQSSSEREMLMNSAVERRRELTEAGQVLNRVEVEFGSRDDCRDDGCVEYEMGISEADCTARATRPTAEVRETHNMSEQRQGIMRTWEIACKDKD